MKTPTSALPGVPEKVWVVASKLSQDGSAVPLESVAAYVSVSPASTSQKLRPGSVKLKAASSVAPWSVTGEATVGASLVLATVITKSSNTDALPVSVAVTLTVIAPTSAFSGVPLNVSVVVLNASHAGRVAPESSVAL